MYALKGISAEVGKSLKLHLAKQMKQKLEETKKCLQDQSACWHHGKQAC